VPGDERTPVADPEVTEADLLLRLERGDLEPLGLLPRSSNFTYLCRGLHEGEEFFAVYKPRAGEAPLWDFPEGTLCRREVAAYVLARALGWPRVPPTVLRDGPQGFGSVQLFLPFDPDHHYFTMMQERPDDFRRVALFDVVANNADRKAGHCLLAEDGRLFVVDHGVCFSEDPKLRTVIWDFALEPIPPAMLDDLRTLAPKLERGPTADRLRALLDEAEVEAARHRLAELVRRASFPEPGPGRPYPWPPV
jgi:uncharacterized repeat protein (TIGR03843 family)